MLTFSNGTQQSIRSRPRSKSIKTKQDSAQHAALAEEEIAKIEVEAATAAMKYEDPRATKKDLESEFSVFINCC